MCMFYMLLDGMCSGLTCEMYSVGGPSTYVYCVICYRVTAEQYLRSLCTWLHS